MLPTKFWFIWPSGFRGEDFFKSANRKQELPMAEQNGMSNSHRGPYIDASYQVSVYLAKLCQSRRFLEIDQSEKRIVCGRHVC